MSHELIHIYNNDILAKYFYEITLEIYWWKPLMYEFRKQMNQIIEFRTEDWVEEFSNHEKKEYIMILVNIKQNYSDKRQRSVLINYLVESKIFLIKRAENILSGKIKLLNAVLIWATITFVFIFSNTIIFDPYFINDNITLIEFE